MKFTRRVKFYYLRFIGLRGEPRELALGAALGIFCGMLPIIPFQTALAVTLAVVFKASKITGALGTWISNPLNWYFQYYYNYKLGSVLLNLPERSAVFSSIMTGLRQGEDPLLIVGKLLGAGSTIVGAFLLGGVVMGLCLAFPSYYVFLHLFSFVSNWRKARKQGRLRGPGS